MPHKFEGETAHFSVIPAPCHSTAFAIEDYGFAAT
jgi:hypothetical protein